MSVCNCKQDCPENDDEITACNWLYNGDMSLCRWQLEYSCFMVEHDKYDSRLSLFCDLHDRKDLDFWSFQQTKQSTSITTQKQIKRQLKEEPNYSVIWSCNRGIYVQSTKDSEGFACFCPDYYYGHRCQYQRKRVHVSLQMQMLSSFNHNISTFSFVVLLIHTNKTITTIISYHQFIYIPRYSCLPIFHMQLLYPINEPYRSLNNHSVHIHMFDRQTLDHRKSWYFPLLFEFLPVQLLVKNLSISDTGLIAKSRQISIPYRSCLSCSNTSQFIGYDISLARDICVCPSNYVGCQCLFPFNPCNITSRNGHGHCQSFEMYRDPENQFVCLCELEWTGKRCELLKPSINVLLARDLTFLLSNIAFLHVSQAFRADMSLETPPHYIYFQRFETETSNITFIIDGFDTIHDIIFIQFYEHQYKFDYYLLSYNKSNKEKQNLTTIEVQSSHRCRSINEIFNTSILLQPALRRVKNYQQPCLQRQYNKDHFLCFYYDYLMCLCDIDNYTRCLTFQTTSNTCDKEWCHGRGICVKDDEMCPVYSQCICEPCFYGSFCQFTSGGYTLSLDGIIGSHILLKYLVFLNNLKSFILQSL